MRFTSSIGRAALMVAAASTLLAPGAKADIDTDFANQLHTFGVYGPRDYNAWVGKIACKRLATHIDRTAFESAAFLKGNLARTTSTDQTWQFLGAAVAAYCPESTPLLRSAADSAGSKVKEQR